jgi:hypothetical protein
LISLIASIQSVQCTNADIFMRISNLLLATVAVLVGFSHLSSNAQTLDLTFGPLYGANRDTAPTLLFGDDYFWLCMDNGATAPSGTQSYLISTEIHDLGGSMWDSFGEDSRNSIATSLINIYGNNFDAIQADLTGEGVARDFQRAAWALIHSRDLDLWTGALTTDGLESVKSWWHSDPGAHALLDTVFIDTDVTGQVYYGSPTTTGQQPVMFLSIDAVPEPSSALLLCGGFLILASRRRRIS